MRKLIPWLILAGLAFGVLLLGPFRVDYQLAQQWAGYLVWGAATAAWLLVRVFQKKSPASSPIDAPLIGLVLAFLLASLLSVDARRGLSVAAQLGVYVLTFMMVVDLIARGWGSSAWVNALLWTSGVVSLLTLGEIITWYAQWYALGGSANPLPLFSYRPTTWLGHANIYAVMVTGLAPLAVARGIAIYRVKAVQISSALNTGSTAIRFFKTPGARFAFRRFITLIGIGLWLVMAAIDLVFASSRGGWLTLLGGLAVMALIVLFPMVKKLLGPSKWIQFLRPGYRQNGPKIAESRFAILDSRKKTLRFALLALLIIVLAGGLGFIAIRQFDNPTHGPLLSSRSSFWTIAWDMFTASPLVGQGPDSYYRFWLAAHPLTQSGLATNPLNVLLQITAETGLVGLLMALSMIALAAWQIIRRFRVATPQEKLTLAAVSAGLVGILVQSLTEVTAVLFPAILFLIVLLALATAPAANEIKAKARIGPWVVRTVLFALVVGFGAYVARAQIPFQAGLEQARSGEWAQAAASIDRAATLDPSFAWYALQAGYAHGMAASGLNVGQSLECPVGQPSGCPADRMDQLKAGINDYQAGIALEPANSLNDFNLALLLWQAGDPASAISALQTAIHLDPGNLSYRLNLGVMLEKTGDSAGAITSYLAALNASPSLASAAFWDTSSIRHTALESSPGQPAAQDAFSLALAAGDQALDSGNPAAAIQQFTLASQMNTFRPEPYRGLGLAEQQAGSITLAGYYLRAATWAYGSFSNKSTLMLSLLDLADLAAAQGQPNQAVTNGLAAFAMIDQYNSPGPGSYNYNPYAWWVFRRESLPGDTLPGLAMADMSPQLAGRFVTLAQRLETGGQSVQACQVYRRILLSVPAQADALKGVQTACSPAG